jgi:lipid-A-disaccharide synthase
MGRRVFISAAEVSGDQHAAHLIAALRALDPEIQINALGGPRMREAGANIVYETTRRAAMGLSGFSRVAELWRVFRWLKHEHFPQFKPDLQICVDSPALNFHFAKLAHGMGIPVLYYIAPQLWAWRESRMKKLKAWVDEVACILPFEQEYFRSHGVEATFVGHPLFDELPRNRIADVSSKYPARAPIVGLLPGSRLSEARANFVHQLDVAARLRQAMPGVTFLVPTTPATDPHVRQLLLEHSWTTAGDTPAVQVHLSDFDHVVPQCDLCLTVSGTATLHVASFGVPMVVVYRTGRMAWHLLGRWLINTRTFSLVNLLGPRERHIVPEFVPWFGSNEPVFGVVRQLLAEPKTLAAQRADLLQMIAHLDQSGASANVARMALALAQSRSPAHA